MWRFFIVRKQKYVYIYQVIYPNLSHLSLPSDLGWSGVEMQDFVR